MTAPLTLSEEAAPPDTQAVLLLCATFGQLHSTDTKPLTLQEYNALALWLARQGRRPGDLLGPLGESLTADDPDLPRAERVRALLRRGVLMAASLERWQRLGLWVISRGEDCYPERLRRRLRSAAPPLLFGAGDVHRLSRGGLAVVGSRNVDEEGLAFTRRVVERCAAADVQIISGGARGVDQAAVSACLDAGGGALAVPADRLDRMATSREAKEPIRSGLLTLATPYEPELGFTVGRAMGRNKHIYGLADYVLVVRFSADKGGTWAGAVEQLRRNLAGPTAVPVFVRVAYNPADGWGELRDRGAVAFPEPECWGGDLAEILGRAAQVAASPPESAAPVGPTGAAPPLSEVTPVVPPSATASPPDEGTETIYSRCVDLLLGSLEGEPGEKELPRIARQLDILPKQYKEWLARAVREGKVKKVQKGRRKVYVDASRSRPTDLFGRGGDAA